MSGTWIYVPKNRFIRIIVNVHRLILFCILLAPVPEIVRHMPYGTVFLMYGFREIMKNFCNFSFIVIVVVRNGSIRKVLHNLQPLITKQNSRKLRKFLVYCFFYRIFRFVVTSTLYITWFRILGFQLNHSCSTYSNISSWTINSVILFVSVIKVIYFAESSSLRQVTQNIHNFSPQKIYLMVTAFVEIKDTISQKISILILFNFISIFVESVVAVVHNIETQGRNAFEGILSKVFFIQHVFQILDIMFLVFLTTKLCHESKGNYETLKRKIALTQDTKEWNFVLDTIKTAQDFEYQAYDCFPINKQILSAFTASLITFTVLFAQLVASNNA